MPLLSKYEQRAPLLAFRKFCDQKLDRLLALGCNLEADLGAHFYALRSDILRKMDGFLRLCIEFRRLNALTEKNSYLSTRIDEILSSCQTLVSLLR